MKLVDYLFMFIDHLDILFSEVSVHMIHFQKPTRPYYYCYVYI